MRGGAGGGDPGSLRPSSRGAWRRIYVVCAAVALYLNVFVGIVQAFQKVPALAAMAPKQIEPPFVVTQLVVLVLFIVLTIGAAKRVPRRVRPHGMIGSCAHRGPADAVTRLY